jgi:flagellar biosynthetic protein FliQ
MEFELAADLVRETILTTLMLAAPILATALGTGLLISIFQAATQVNEQTLTFVPKIVLTLGVFAVCFPQAMAMLVEFSRRLLTTTAGGAP